MNYHYCTHMVKYLLCLYKYTIINSPKNELV